MKTLSQYINESEAWYIPFIKLFETDAEGILRAGGVRFKQAGKVVHRGSAKSRVFGIRYLNSAGVWCAYDFEMAGPGPKSQGIYAKLTNSKAEELIQKNIKKLPKLRYDTTGNVLN